MKTVLATKRNVAAILDRKKIGFNEQDLAEAVCYLNGPRVCSVYDRLSAWVTSIVRVPEVAALRSRRVWTTKAITKFVDRYGALDADAHL